MTDNPGYQERPSVYQQDGITIYRASDIGGCVTRLAAARQGQGKQESKGYQRSIFDAGHAAEDRFFELRPDLAHYRQMEVILKVTPTIWVVGHLDAYAEDRIIEVKSQSDKEYEKWEWEDWEENPLWVKYSWQVSSCMLGLGDESIACVVRFNRDTEEYSMDWIREPFISREQIFEKVLEVEALAQEEKLTCVTPEFFCQYPQLHADVDIVDDQKLEVMVASYMAAKRRVDEFSEEVSKLRENISERLDELGYQKLMLMSGRRVSRSEYDTKDHMVKGSHQVRITIK